MNRQQLIHQIKEKKTYLCIGLDTDVTKIPNHFNAPEIAAKSGWTTFEIAEHILHTQLNEKYDFVTLLIGVNNQYRNLLADNYREDFEFLLKKSVHFAGDLAAKVMVLSMPDWGATPFAKTRDGKKIAEAINQFNMINKELSDKYGVHYIDITKGSRNAGNDISLLADDKLHYSGKLYETWATQVADAMDNIIHR